MLCHTQYIRNLALNEQSSGRASVVCLCSLLWSLSDKGTRVRFCWVPSHCGIDGNERVDQLAKKTFDQDIDPLASVNDTDMKPLVNSYIQKLVQTKCDAHSSSIWSMVSSKSGDYNLISPG